MYYIIYAYTPHTYIYTPIGRWNFFKAMMNLPEGSPVCQVPMISPEARMSIVGHRHLE